MQGGWAGGLGRRFAPAGDGTASYVEHLQVPALSVGTYSIPVGSVDDQVPHAEDETSW